MIKLSCHSCGANVQVQKDQKTFACEHCGAAYRLRQEDGVLVPELLSRTAEATEKTAAELAVPRLRQELAALDLQIAMRGGTPRFTGGASGCATWFVLFVTLSALGEPGAGFLIALPVGIGVGIAVSSWLVKRKKRNVADLEVARQKKAAELSKWEGKL